MAPRTRRLKRIVTMDNSQITTAGNQARSDLNTQGDAGSIQHQTVGATTITNNLKGKSQFFLWLDLSDTTGNRKKMYHCHQ